MRILAALLVALCLAVPARAGELIDLTRAIAPEGASGDWTVAQRDGVLVLDNPSAGQGLLINALPRDALPVDLSAGFVLRARVTVQPFANEASAGLGLAYSVDARHNLSAFALVKANGEAALMDYNGQALEPRLLTPLALAPGREAAIELRVDPPAEPGQNRWSVSLKVDGHDAGAVGRSVGGDVGIVALGRGRFTFRQVTLQSFARTPVQSAAAE